MNLDDNAKEIMELERKILSVESQVLIRLTTMESIVVGIEKQITSYVSKEKFEPVAYIAYGLAAGVLTTALGAVLAQVFV